MGRVCLLSMEAGGQIALRGGKEVREGRGGGEGEQVVQSQQPRSARST